MRITAIALIVSLLALSNVLALPAVAASAAKVGQEAGTWRRVADATPLGTKVKIQRVDGTRVSGTLVRADDTGVALKRNARIPEAPVIVSYEVIANMERDGGGMGWAKAIGIGVATGVSAMLTVFVIALQFD